MKTRVLKPEYQELADAFDNSQSCSCHISPPCGKCVDAGNPDNLAENDDAWEDAE